MNYKKIKVELGNIKRGGAVTDEQIANALNEYFAKNPVKDGESGGYYKPIMYADGTLMFVPTKADMDAVGSVGNVKGKDGYTPQKGVDYFDGADGYTPQKGIDYFDGKDGDKGDNGGYYRPHLTPEGHLVFTASEEGMLEVGDLGRIKGTDGRGIATIERINGTGLPGTTDTYKITFTDESAFTFDVYNGKDGADDAPPDYEQNDSTALDYIKNRPFYSVKTEIYTDREKAQRLNGISVSFDLEVGKAYDVTINGTVYSCVCEQSTYNDSEANKLTCGNYAIYVANRTLYFTYPNGEDNLTINITIALEDIKKLDKKYLPDDIGGGGVGKDGKSAYEYAKEAGYEGTEEEFAEKLAINPDWIATKKVDGGEETYISQQTLTSGMWSKLQMNFQVGITYDVYFNGEIYPCVAGNEDGGIYLGNITLIESASPKPHNNEPFCIYWAGAGATGGFFYKASTVSYPITLKVTSHADVVYNKMPKEYLPDGVAMKEDIPDVPEIPEQVQPDWSQNDETAPDYVKNRTHYEEISEDIVLMCDGQFARRTELQGVTLEIGKEYTVVYDGITYISVCWDDGGFKTIGGAINDYSQYPFNISSDSDAAPEFTCADSNKHSIRISAVAIKKVVKKLDKKYLPDDIGGGTSIDVTAEVGQTIIVKEVDANGKPTKWESADYQPRTHWEEVVLPETTGEVDPEMGDVMLPPFTLIADETYNVKYNGVEYICKCFGAEGTFVLGNLEAVGVTGGNGEPFVVLIESLEGESYAGVMDLTGATSSTISISRSVPIPQTYLTNAFPYYIEVEGTFADESSLVCNDTVANVGQKFASGRTLVLKASGTEGNNPFDLFFTFSHRQKNLATGQICYGFYYFLPLISNPTNAYQNVLLLSQEDGTFKVTTQLTDL